MQLAYPLLEASGNGSVIMNSSVAGGPGAINTGSLYAMSKGAATAMTGHCLPCDTTAVPLRVACATMHDYF